MRYRDRLLAAKERAAVGKISGATGSRAALGVKGIELQERVLAKFVLGVPIATTQIVQRDRHAKAIIVQPVSQPL